MMRCQAAVCAVGVMLALVSEAAGQSTTTVAQEINVGAGETMTLAETRYLSWYLDRLVMGDGATLQLGPETKAFLLRAHIAEIGDGARIVGTGSLGSTGEQGADKSGGERERGEDGKPGGIGGTGPTITLVFQDQATVQNLTVAASGGQGGTGGLGGVGSPSHIGQCEGRGAINSGDAGNGGPGGRGGRGGTVLVLLPESARDQPGSDRTINAIADGGPGGAGGGARRARPGAPEVGCLHIFGRPTYVRGGAAPGATGQSGPGGDSGP